MPPKNKSKKPLKKPSVKPRKNIIRSTITKQNVKQVVNVHLPKSRTYRRSTDGKTITKTIVHPSPSMVQPVYVPQPQPYNFNNFMEPVSNSLELLIKKLSEKPHIEEKEEKTNFDNFTNIYNKDKNESFLNELENKKIIDKVDEIRPIDENIYEPEDLVDNIKLKKPVDNKLFDLAKKYQQRNKMYETLDEIKRNNENKMMGQEDVKTNVNNTLEDIITQIENKQKIKDNDVVKLNKSEKYEKEFSKLYNEYKELGGTWSNSTFKKHTPEGMDRKNFLKQEIEKLKKGEQPTPKPTRPYKKNSEI